MAAALNMNRPSVTGPGDAQTATLEAFRTQHREQELAFQMAADRWCAAVNAPNRFGTWDYVLAWNASDLVAYLDAQPTMAVA